MTLSHAVLVLIAYAGPVQVALFAAILIVLWLTERAVLAQATRAKIHHTFLNALFVSGTLPVQILMMLPCLALADWAASRHIGLVHLLPYAANPWIKFGLMFVALDALDYLYHVLMHHIPFLWRLHLRHHTDTVVDVSTTFREHPGETFVRNGFLMLCVLLCGTSVAVLVLRQLVQIVANVLAHTALRLPSGPARVIGWVFVTPNLHHAHHHFQRPATNSN